MIPKPEFWTKSTIVSVAPKVFLKLFHLSRHFFEAFNRAGFFGFPFGSLAFIGEALTEVVVGLNPGFCLRVIVESNEYTSLI